MVDIQGKRILLVGIGFYDYEKILVDFLEKRGAKVYYFSSFINNWRQRLLRRIGLVNKAIRMSSWYISTKIKEAPAGIDQILIIKGEDFSQEHIDALNSKYPGVKKTLYLWDSLERLSNKDLLLENFATILTFDRLDAEKYGLKFRPLFARDMELSENRVVKYDISFVGYMHSTRYDVLKRLKDSFDRENIKYRFILTTGWFEKFFLINVSHRVRKEDSMILMTSRLPYSEYMNILQSSNVVLDIAHPKQSGLTMRTIETLAQGKKLLTTNSDIKSYAFNKKQYMVLDPSSDIDYVFLRNHNLELSDMSNFTLERFVEELLTA